MLSNIFFKFWRILSLPFLAITFIINYVTLPDTIAIHHTELGLPDGFVGKETFFYSGFAIIIIFNLLINLLKSQALKLDYLKLKPTSEWAKNTDQLKAVVEGWMDAIIAYINSFLAIVLIALNRINRGDGQKLDLNYNIIIMIAAALFVFILVFLPIRLLYTSPKEES